MAKFILDTSIDPTILDYEQTEELDGREYLIRFVWNDRDESWSLSLYLTDGTPLALGRKCVLGVPLLWGEIDSRLPPGVLLVVDPTGSNTDPGVDEFGARVKLVYNDAEELAA